MYYTRSLAHTKPRGIMSTQLERGIEFWCLSIIQDTRDGSVPEASGNKTAQDMLLYILRDLVLGLVSCWRMRA